MIERIRSDDLVYEESKVNFITVFNHLQLQRDNEIKSVDKRMIDFKKKLDMMDFGKKFSEVYTLLDGLKQSSYSAVNTE